MILVAVWDIIDSIQDDGRWNKDKMLGVYEIISLVLAVETMVIYFKFPRLVLTDDQIGEHEEDRRRR
jgi:hypothetical protein